MVHGVELSGPLGTGSSKMAVLAEFLQVHTSHHSVFGQKQLKFGSPITDYYVYNTGKLCGKFLF